MLRTEYEPRNDDARQAIAAAMYARLREVHPDVECDIADISSYIAARLSGLFGMPLDDCDDDEIEINYWYANNPDIEVNVCVPKDLLRQSAAPGDRR